jgi:hypothetical protein
MWAASFGRLVGLGGFVVAGHVLDDLILLGFLDTPDVTHLEGALALILDIKDVLVFQRANVQPDLLLNIAKRTAIIPHESGDGSELTDLEVHLSVEAAACREGNADPVSHVAS